MEKLPRRLYLFVSVLFILIGMLHLMVHYQDLLEPHIETALSHSISVMGNEASVWKMWQGFSFMMGGMMIIIGCLNIAFMSQLKKSNPPIASILIMMLLLGMVVYSGKHFFGPEQFYGGLFGESLLLIALLRSFRKQPTETLEH